MGIKKVQGNNKNFNNPLTMESMNKFLEFLVEHGLERKDEPLIPNPDRPQKAYTNVDNKRRLSGYMHTMITMGWLVAFVLTIEQVSLIILD